VVRGGGERGVCFKSSTFFLKSGYMKLLKRLAMDIFTSRKTYQINYLHYCTRKHLLKFRVAILPKTQASKFRLPGALNDIKVLAE